MELAQRDKRGVAKAAMRDENPVDDKKWREDSRRALLTPRVAVTGASMLALYLLGMLFLGKFAGNLAFVTSGLKLIRGRALASMATPTNSTTEGSLESLLTVPRDMTVNEIIDHVAGPQRSLIVVPVTSNYLDFTFNFFHSVEKIGLGGRVLFVTVDDESWELLHTNYPDQTVRVQSLGAPEPLKGNKSEAVFNSVFFHSVVDRKPVYIRALLERNVSVLFSDADIVLLGDPHKYFTGGYDVWVTKDTGTFSDAHKLFPKDAAMPLNRKAITGDGHYMCSCFVYARPTPGGKLVMDRWIKAIKDQVKRTGKGIADQLMMNKVLVETPQVTAKVAVLPIPTFPSGCLFFGAVRKPCPFEHKLYQKAVSLGKVTPLWAHNNWIKGHDVKLKRFVDHDLWFVNAPGAKSQQAVAANKTATATATPTTTA